MQPSPALKAHKPWLQRLSPNGEWVLAVALAVELGIFTAIGENFFTLANFFEVVRLSVELGLLSLAMTAIMITGGIDLSVGSLMGQLSWLYKTMLLCTTQPYVPAPRSESGSKNGARVLFCSTVQLFSVA